uniref:Uncharacterized protein n=1 Tax=Arcella intermedia TaxID=1963864 RepID=A0A6B2LJI7_9EUKA
MGSIASCTAVTFSNPLEVVKTRLQLQGELQKQGFYVKSYNGMFHGMYMIWKNEGIRGIQKGLFLAYPYTITMNGTRLGLYATVKSKVAKVLGMDVNSMPVGMLSGAIAGTVGTFFANPFYVTKTRIQSQSAALPVGHQHQYASSWQALLGVYRESGIKGYATGLQGSKPSSPDSSLPSCHQPHHCSLSSAALHL